MKGRRVYFITAAQSPIRVDAGKKIINCENANRLVSKDKKEAENTLSPDLGNKNCQKNSNNRLPDGKSGVELGY